MSRRCKDNRSNESTEMVDYLDKLITLDDIREHLDYYFDEGIFYWRKTVSYRMRAGSKAGGFRVKNNRVLIGFRGKYFDAAEIALFLHTGRVPEFPVKFKDGNPRNLKYSNLYEDVIW